MPPSVEVELDIFSGMPNPAWVLTNAESESFMKRLSALPPASAKELSGNLGYRGFIVRVKIGNETQFVRVQNGIVHISKGVTSLYACDEGRQLERWLLSTGKPHLKNDIFQLVERELR